MNAQTINMNPDLVYQLVAANPNLRNLVEQTAQLMQLQQQASQMAPVIQQMAQNPAGAMRGYVNWQAQQGQMQPQSQPQQTQMQSQSQGIQQNQPLAQLDQQDRPLAQMDQQNQQNQQMQQAHIQQIQPNQQQNQEGQQMGMYEQAMAIVGEMRKNFEVLNNNLREIYDAMNANNEKLDKIIETQNQPAPDQTRVRKPADKEAGNAASAK